MTTENIISKNKPVLQPLFHQLYKNDRLSVIKNFKGTKNKGS